jgi:hypothetical protein
MKNKQSPAKKGDQQNGFPPPDPMELATLAAILRPDFSRAADALAVAMRWYFEAVLFCRELPSNFDELFQKFASHERQGARNACSLIFGLEPAFLLPAHVAFIAFVGLICRPQKRLHLVKIKRLLCGLGICRQHFHRFSGIVCDVSLPPRRSERHPHNFNAIISRAGRLPISNLCIAKISQHHAGRFDSR